MKLWIVIVISIALSCYVLFSFMMVAFGGGAMANNPNTSKGLIAVMDFLLFALPASSVLGVVMIWVAYYKDWGALHYWWIATPLPLTVLLFWLMFNKLPS